MANAFQMLIYLTAVLGLLDLALVPFVGVGDGRATRTDEDGPF